MKIKIGSRVKYSIDAISRAKLPQDSKVRTYKGKLVKKELIEHNFCATVVWDGKKPFTSKGIPLRALQEI